MLHLYTDRSARADYFLKRAAASADAAQAANAFRSPEAEKAFRVIEQLWMQLARSEARPS